MSIQSVLGRTGAKWFVGTAAALGAAFYVTGSTPWLSASPRSDTGRATAALVAPVATTSYADAVSLAAPAVVTVQVDKKADVQDAGMPDEFFQRFFNQPGPGGQNGQGGSNRRRMPQQSAPMEHGLGSAVIVSADGNLLTNNHVVEGADHVMVTLNDGREFTAKVVGTDPATDLAVIHINATDLPILSLADSDRVRVGDVVLAIGDPLGIGQTVTMGIISAKSRTTGSGDGSYEDFLQTDAPINKGNSGGALITTTGQLIGINSQIMSPSGGSIGIGFAIPSNMAAHVMSELESTGHVRRAMLGVTVQPLTSDLAKSLGLGSVHGALVNSVEPSGPAARAGIKQGDVILRVNGAVVDDSNGLRNRVSAMVPGSSVTVDIERDGREQHLTSTLAELPDSTKTASVAPAASGDLLGMTLEALTPDLARQLRLPSGSEGVAVTDIDPSGAAARAGIQSGDVIRQVDGQPVRSAPQLKDALNRGTDKPALLYVQRGANSFYLALGAR
jgi:Do/DeqQ family serine protease